MESGNVDGIKNLGNLGISRNSGIYGIVCDLEDKWIANVQRCCEMLRNVKEFKGISEISKNSLRLGMFGDLLRLLMEFGEFENVKFRGV